MNIKEYKQSLNDSEPSEKLPEPLKALWWDAKGNWEKAHNYAQKKEGTLPYDLVHAYLHRKEGDNWNAEYWYNRCQKKIPIVSLETEWENLVNEFLNTLIYVQK